jgi:hypothetical protein
MGEFDGSAERSQPLPRGWSAQHSLDVLARDAFDFSKQEAKYQKEGLKSKDDFEGPLAKAIEKGDTTVVQLFDSFHVHKPGETVEQETHYLDKTGPKVAGKLSLHYDGEGQPASAEFRDELGNVENVTIDSKTRALVAQDHYQTAQGANATFDFNGAELSKATMTLGNGTEQYEFDGGRLSHHIFSINGGSLELRDDKTGKTITASGPPIGRNPIVKEQYDYGAIDTTPRTIEFTVANGKQYRGQQLPDGRWKVSELK